jgi:catalase
MHRQAIHRGRVSYEPNSLGGGSPFQAGGEGHISFPEPVVGSKVRGKAEKFADHFSQATLFWNSQTPFEQAHIVRGFRFELSKVQVPAIRERTVSMLRNVSDDLARAVADGLGMPLPKAMTRFFEPPAVEITESPALSLTARPGDTSIRGRKVAILIGTGVVVSSVAKVEEALIDAGAVVRRVAATLGPVEGPEGDLEPDATFEMMPSVLFDGVVVPEREAESDGLRALGQPREFLRDQYRHCKAILIGSEDGLASDVGLPADDESDWAVVRDVTAFISALGRHRNWERATDPPRI